MKYAPLGINYETKKLLSEPIDEDFLVENIVNFEGTQISKGMGAHDISADATRTPDPNVRWTYIVHEDDENINEYIKIIKPLANLRRMRIPDLPLKFYGQKYEWKRWMQKNLENTPIGTRPNYILIVGDPELIPFGFQSRLDVKANVGRICFDTLDELQNYTDKLVRLQKTPPKLEKKATFFAPNWGKNQSGRLDATHYSYNELAKPLLKYVKNDLVDANITTEILSENEATKDNLNEKLKASKSTFVFVASHGVGNAPTLDKQIELTGAIACQNWNNTHSDDDLYRAKDIPDDKNKPFLEGSVFFQFSCFSYGTPKYDDVANFSLDGSTPKEEIADKPLIAAIPKKLLAHPRGPVAFIGHVNEAYLEGFYDNNKALPEEDRRSLTAYQSIVHSVFHRETMGTALNDMNMNGADAADALSDTIGDYVHGDKSSTKKREIAKNFLIHHDAKNYLLFGDPAVTINF